MNTQFPVYVLGDVMYFFYLNIVILFLMHCIVVLAPADSKAFEFFLDFFLSVCYKISLGRTFPPYVDTMLNWLRYQFVFKDIYHYLQLDQTKDFDLYLNILSCPCLPCLVRKSAADKCTSGRSAHPFLGW